MLTTKQDFAAAAGVTPSAISKALRRGLVVAQGSGANQMIDPDIPLNRQYLEARYDQRRTAQYQRYLKDRYGRSSGAEIEQSGDEQGAASEEESSYYGWWVRRLILGAFAEGDGAILFFTRYGDCSHLFRHVAIAARKAKDSRSAAVAVEKILAKVADEAAGELKKMEALFLTFESDDDEPLRRELNHILDFDEDGNPWNEPGDEPEGEKTE